jgi:hypothetical protein
MIFAASTDERSLTAFATEEEAIAYCEGLDVEAGEWLFWDDTGHPLLPEFYEPNKRGLLLCASGRYRLVPSHSPGQAVLREALVQLVHFEGPAPYTSAEAVLAHMLRHAFLQNGRSGGEI